LPLDSLLIEGLYGAVGAHKQQSHLGPALEVARLDAGDSIGNFLVEELSVVETVCSETRLPYAMTTSSEATTRMSRLLPFTSCPPAMWLIFLLKFSQFTLSSLSFWPSNFFMKIFPEVFAPIMLGVVPRTT
jgi:hypothetical protein